MTAATPTGTSRRTSDTHRRVVDRAAYETNGIKAPTKADRDRVRRLLGVRAA